MGRKGGLPLWVSISDTELKQLAGAHTEKEGESRGCKRKDNLDTTHKFYRKITFKKTIHKKIINAELPFGSLNHIKTG